MIDDREPLGIERISLVENHRLALNTAAVAASRCTLRSPFVRTIGQIIDTTDVNKHFEMKIRFVAQGSRDLDKVILIKLIGQLTTGRFDSRELLAEPSVDPSG